MTDKSLLQSVINGCATGFGSAIGSYLALKWGIEHLNKLPNIRHKARKILTIKNPLYDKKREREDQP